MEEIKGGTTAVENSCGKGLHCRTCKDGRETWKCRASRAERQSFTNRFPAACLTGSSLVALGQPQMSHSGVLQQKGPYKPGFLKDGMKTGKTVTHWAMVCNQ